MRKRGFALPTVIALVGLVAIIVTAGLVISHSSRITTLSTVRFQLAEEASDACLARALDEINATGVCGNRDFNHTQLGINFGAGVECTVQLRQSGRICFIRSIGQMGNSRVFKTAILQSFFGMGLYTVRGGVNATYSGGLLSGCYYETNNNCFVPAFIVSTGTVNLGGATVQQCPANNPNMTTGIWGTPPIFTNAMFTNLVPLFFNVNCFSSNFYRNNVVDQQTGAREGEQCNYGLTDALVDTYALIYRDGRPDFSFNSYGEPVINQTLLSDLTGSASINSGPPNCRVTLNQSMTIDLTSLLTNSTLNSLLGGQLAQCQSIEIYSNHSLTISGTPPIPTTIYMRRSDQNSVAPALTISGASGQITGRTPFGENIYNLRIYSAGPVNITANSGRFRLLNTNTINVSSGVTISETTIIQALLRADQNNDPASPQNLIAGGGTGTLTITDSKLFTRQLRFGTLFAWRDLVYVYANACPDCSRDTNDASIRACNSDARRCGWAYGSSNRDHSAINNAFFGTDSNRNIQDASGRPLVSILINNNSVVRGNQNFFGGIFFGQDVNYIQGTSTVVRGFLIRNFPPGLGLSIGFNNTTDFRFRLDAINNLRFDPNRPGFPGFWFVRRVDCVSELPTPTYMAIITRMTSW